MDVELLDCKIRIKSDIGKFIDCWIGVACWKNLLFYFFNLKNFLLDIARDKETRVK